MISDSAAARVVFGNRLGQAEEFARLLASAGLERGLIGPREVHRLWNRHLLNCGVVAELVPYRAMVADIGSGAGLPGLVLAIARPDLDVLLIESRLRPTTFLRECVDALDLRSVTVWRGRAEDAAGQGEADVVTARAVAALPRLAQWALPLLRPGGALLALKGGTAETEFRDAWPRVSRRGYAYGEVVQVGAEKVGCPTTVVRLVAG